VFDFISIGVWDYLFEWFDVFVSEYCFDYFKWDYNCDLYVVGVVLGCGLMVY